MALIYNATFAKNTRKLSFEDRAGNEIYSFTVPERGPVDDITKPLTFKATQDGSTVKLTKKGRPDGDFQVSRDGGNTWENYTFGTITLNTGDEVSFREKDNRIRSQTMQNYFQFKMTGKIEAWHNVMSLYSANDFATYSTVLVYAFYHLFDGCASLTKAPVLPATKLAQNCYHYMFSGCQSLAKAPVLPATTLATSCYEYMFSGCQSLTKAPELPSTTLEIGCYEYMFSGCQSLTKAPELPATTLFSGCYYGMFSGCQSLAKAPELPATTLADYCYRSMFQDCQSLKEVRVSATTTATDSLTDWLSGVSATGDFYCDPNATIFPTDSASGIPANWRRLNINEGAPTVDDITKPLTFKATQDGSTVALGRYGNPSGSFQMSRDGGNTWVDYTIGNIITLNIGEEVSFRAKENRTEAQSRESHLNFNMTGEIEAWHNVMSLYRTNDFATYNTMVEAAFNGLFTGCASLTKAPKLPATTLSKDCYEFMFDGCSLTEAPELPATTLVFGCYSTMFRGCLFTKAPVLPATTLADFCYYYMFSDCRSLTKAPALPATTLTKGCYKFMFDGCQSLTEAPELPATTLAINCYESMFSGCQSLTKAPVLPATTLADYCYSIMFSGCQSLTKAPELPATTLAKNCYAGMFSGCQSLTKAPELPATTLVTRCYQRMFEGCQSLTKAPELPATTLASSCYINMFDGCRSLKEVRVSATTTATNALKEWLKNVSATGDFYCNPNATIFPTGTSGIPENWTRHNIADYPTT